MNLHDLLIGQFPTENIMRLFNLILRLLKPALTLGAVIAATSACAETFTSYPTFFANAASEQSESTPAVVQHKGALYTAWRGIGNNQINIMVSLTAGQVFAGKFTSSEATSSEPALASDGNDLYVAWRGVGNNYLNVAKVNLDPRTYAAVSLDAQTKLTSTGRTTYFGPSLAALKGNLYLGWTGTDGRLNVQRLLKGGTWSYAGQAPQALPMNLPAPYVDRHTSERGLKLTAVNNRMIISWVGTGNAQINYSYLWIASNGEVQGITSRYDNPNQLGTSVATNSVGRGAPSFVGSAPTVLKAFWINQSGQLVSNFVDISGDGLAVIPGDTLYTAKSGTSVSCVFDLIRPTVCAYTTPSASIVWGQ